MSNPLITVVMPVYNAERYVSAAVRSIAAQTVRDFELVVVDDGSSDESLRILQRLAAEDGRVKLFSRPNTGIVGALADGLALSRGTFIARMDADDIAYPDRFAKQLAFLAAHPSCVAVGGSVLQIDADGDAIGVKSWPASAAQISADLLQGRGGIPHPTAMMRAAAVREVGGYRYEHEWVEDKDLWLRLDEIGTLANIPDVVLAYRLTGSSVCSHKQAEQARRMVRLLEQTYRRRGIAAAVPPFSSRDGRATVGGAVIRKWIRTSARQGYRRTASKYSRRLMRESPFAASTWWTLAGAAVSRWKRRRAAPPIALPVIATTLPDPHRRAA